jgi:hypothetical protein
VANTQSSIGNRKLTIVDCQLTTAKSPPLARYGSLNMSVISVFIGTGWPLRRYGR